MVVRMFGEHSTSRRAADGSAGIFANAAEVLGHIISVRRDEHFPVWLEKQLDPFPVIGDEARACAGRFEYPRCRRKAITSHALAADVKYHSRCAIERIVLMSIDMT